MSGLALSVAADCRSCSHIPAGRAELPGRVELVCALSLAAIAVHSLFYASFFEDPATWGFLALAAALRGGSWMSGSSLATGG